MAQRRGRVVAVPLLAGIAGAAAGILLAPRSGKETRANLHTKAKRLQSGAQEGMQSAKQSLKQGAQEASEAKTKATEAITRKARGVAQDAKKGAEETPTARPLLNKEM